jgi:hypothetical protein
LRTIDLWNDSEDYEPPLLIVSICGMAHRNYIKINRLLSYAQGGGTQVSLTLQSLAS